MKKQTIKVTEVRVETDPSTVVFQLEMTDDATSWNETFNTKELLAAFLRGLRVATCQVAGTFNMEQYWEFDKDSIVERLP